MPLYLLSHVAGQPVALPADAIGSVVELGTIVPVPCAAPHIAGLCALRSRVLTVIDAHAAICASATGNRGALAVVVDVAGHGYALAVERVDDVIEAPAPQPCAAAMTPAWTRVGRGMIEVDGCPVLLIDPAALVDGPDAATSFELT